MAKAVGAAIPAALGLGSTASTIGSIAAPLALGGIGALMSKGGGSSGGAGSTVDPAALAAAQGQSNVTTAQTQAALNNINTNSPWGSSWYQPTSWDPTTGKPSSYTLNQNLSPELQDLFNQQTGLTRELVGAGRGQVLGQGTNLMNMAQAPLGTAANWANNLIAPQLDLSNVQPIANLTPGSFRTGVTGGAGGQALPGVQTSVNSDFPTLIKQAQDAAYQQQTQYLDPQFRQGRQQLVQMLADQGVQPGTEAYDRATGDFDRQQQQAYQSAQSAAVQAGNQQEQALFGQSLQAGQFTNQAQQQMFGQGFNLANLYNQAVLGASNQNIQANQTNLQRAQAQFGAPITAANAQLGIGTGLFDTGMGTFPTVAGMANIAPTWPISIPTMGGSPATVAPTNLASLTGAATGQNQFANAMRMQSLNNMLGGADMASKALFGQPLLGGGGGGGLFGLLGGGGGGGGSLLDWTSSVPFEMG